MFFFNLIANPWLVFQKLFETYFDKKIIRNYKYHVLHFKGGRPAAELEWRKDGKRVVDLQKVGTQFSVKILTYFPMKKYKKFFCEISHVIL